MQRKNYLLRRSCLKHRNGMAMVMAIAVIVILATIMALSLSLSTKSTKETTDLYLYEQAVLLSQSAAEYTLLQISKNNPCSVPELNFHPPSPLDYYDINISLQYVYTEINTCNTGGGTSYFVTSSPEQNGSVLMDITVSVPTSANVTSEPITYFRRSIQKL